MLLNTIRSPQRLCSRFLWRFMQISKRKNLMNVKQKQSKTCKDLTQYENKSQRFLFFFLIRNVVCKQLFTRCHQLLPSQYLQEDLKASWLKSCFIWKSFANYSIFFLKLVSLYFVELPDLFFSLQIAEFEANFNSYLILQEHAVLPFYFGIVRHIVRKSNKNVLNNNITSYQYLRQPKKIKIFFMLKKAKCQKNPESFF